MPAQQRRALFIFISLIVLLTSVILMSGLADLRWAEADMRNEEFGKAAKSYVQAARIFPWQPDLWEKAGLAASADADYENAVSYLSNQPKLSERGWQALGNSYLMLGEYDSALDAYRKGIVLYDSASLYGGLAYIYREQHNWTAESDALRNETRVNAQDAYAHYRLGLLLALLEPDKSLSELMQASSLDPKTDPAVQTLRAALNIASTQAEPAQQALTIGRAFGLVHEWALAQAAFEHAIALDPESGEAFAWLGEAKQHTGEDGSADLNKSLSLQPSSVIVHALRGLYWNRRKDYAKVLVEYQRAAQLEPDNPAWQAEIGDAFAKLADLPSAFQAYQRAADLAPAEATYWRLLAVFCAENGVYVEEAGLPAAQKATQLAPDDPASLDALGWVYLASGRYANAEQTLLDVAARFPDYLAARIHLAMTYLAEGNQASARNELNAVRAADADGPDGQLAAKLLSRYFP